MARSVSKAPVKRARKGPIGRPRTVVRAKKGPPGRPSFKPTAEQRHMVEVSVGAMTYRELASALKITVPTLEKHFREELDHGAMKSKMAVLGRLYQMALKRNVSAQKAYIQYITMGGVPAQEKEKKPPKAPKLGKKEQAVVDASAAPEAGTTWDNILPLHGGKKVA